MVAESAVSARAAMVPGTALTNPQWLGERIADMGISWGTGNSRVAGTLWWCMAASSLVDPIATAYAEGRPAHVPELEHLRCEIRPDGGVERVLPVDEGAGQDAAAAGTGRVDTVMSPRRGHSDSGDTAVAPPVPEVADDRAVGPALRKSLGRIIPAVAEVSGAGVASLWAIVADTIGNRALDAGDAEAGSRLAREVAGRLPVPRFTDIGGRTFVRRISCCLVFEVPGCEMCTSCPKRPPAQRHALLSELAARR
ncbi:(2Fe-2S)-binding protein [Nocardia sp. BMG51109]|uniref:(2Fe-2S)-binding protein n=1 Tax=Nocardia sp. BMG51109 TaxID=1056816 RepID=UPI000466BAE3|nr:(2Fe-2S)-binding protein [Nocardia sp. BMG51109]